MKKIFCVILCAVILLSAASCGEAEASDVDIDLTKMSSSLVYSAVNNMMTTPQSYIGKTVRVNGQYNASFYEPTSKYYHYVIIADATACCSQGIEFIWNGEHNYPGDYPDVGSDINLTGVFGSYDELGVTYYYLSVDSIA